MILLFIILILFILVILLIVKKNKDKFTDIKNVAFWDNQLCERGTSLGLFNYAYYNQTLLGNKSFIFYDKNNKENKKHIIEKFKKYFIVHGTNNFNEVDLHLKKYNINHIFIIKSGQKDGKISNVAKNCVQCVFNCFEPHGDIYCSISNSVPGNNGKYPVIPRIITLPNSNLNLRSKLNIDNNAIVFGGYGGKKNFSIKYVQETVYDIAKNNSNIYFVFANFDKFCPDLKNIIHLPMIEKDIDKVKFINTCNAMLWARKDGETFGQAIGEFSIKNKPVIATKVGDLAHVEILNDKGIWYENKNDLMNILLNFEDNYMKLNKNWNAFTNFTPSKVMEKLNNIFLKL